MRVETPYRRLIVKITIRIFGVVGASMNATVVQTKAKTSLAILMTDPFVPTLGGYLSKYFGCSVKNTCH